MIASLRCAHGLLWQSDPWYRRAWWIGPQVLAVVFAVAVLTGSLGGGAAAPAVNDAAWGHPVSPQAAYESVWALRDRARTDPAEFAKLRALATTGDANAQFRMGTLYDPDLKISTLVSPDLPTALAFYRDSAAQGELEAANNYGYRLAFGRGVARNLDEGMRYLTFAANKNFAYAQMNLGILYRDGAPSLPASLSTALQWFQRAADAGNHYSQVEIGAAFWEGRANYRKDPFEAVKWYTAASQDPNLTVAARVLGIAYRDGIGATQNAQIALTWFQRAAERNDAYSIEQVRLLRAPH